jgi:hypothetical protein
MFGRSHRASDLTGVDPCCYQLTTLSGRFVFNSTFLIAIVGRLIPTLTAMAIRWYLWIGRHSRRAHGIHSTIRREMARLDPANDYNESKCKIGPVMSDKVIARVK